MSYNDFETIIKWSTTDEMKSSFYTFKVIFDCSKQSLKQSRASNKSPSDARREVFIQARELHTDVKNWCIESIGTEHFIMTELYDMLGTTTVYFPSSEYETLFRLKWDKIIVV